MRTHNFSLGWRVILATSILFGGMLWAASQETTLHSFGNGSDGSGPGAPLIRDAAGNLYGTTVDGGIHGDGTVFELSPRQGGGWSEKVLHSFGKGSDGVQPWGGVVLDAVGNLYGTTFDGGIHGEGTVFELSPQSDGSWSEKVIHSFGSGTDGVEPESGLVLDANGNLFGTTGGGGIHNYGTAYELSPQQGGGWTERILHSFNFDTDGGYIDAGLVLDADGNLYGAAAGGGPGIGGAIFELSPQGNGEWTAKLLHSFSFQGGAEYDPQAALTLDANGNLYGTTFHGGIHGAGTIFELISDGGGAWTERVLHSFGGPDDGQNGDTSLVWDTAGNLYGITGAGGIHGYGTVFELSPRGDGDWTEKVLHSFNQDGNQPFSPAGGVILDGAGNLYGVTANGGIHGAGTVFELQP
jgi:uncharacterized repeat protein (TIGR03803 family)